MSQIYEVKAQTFKTQSGTVGGNVAVRSVTTTDTATVADEILLLSGASFTQNLPTAVGNTGKTFTIKHNGTSLTQVYTLDGNGSQTIDGATTYGLYTNGETVKLVSDGANWHVIEHKTATDWIADGTVSSKITGTGGTNPNINSNTILVNTVRWRREGRDAIVNYSFAQSTVSGGTPGTGDYKFALPSGLTIDITTPSITAYTTVVAGIHNYTNSVGWAAIKASTSNQGSGVYVYDSTNVRIGSGGAGATAGGSATAMVSASIAAINDANIGYNFEIRVPIVGWKP